MSQQKIQISVPVAVRFIPSLGEYRPRTGRLFLEFGPRSQFAEEMFGVMQACDAWEMRREFFRSGETLYGFTSKFGRFSRTPLRVSPNDPTGERAFRRWRRVLRRLIQLPRERWPSLRRSFPKEMRVVMATPLPLRVEWKIERKIELPLGVVEARTILDAILATIQLDKVMNRRFGQCAQRDCGGEFEFTSRHGRMYCSYACAHLEAVRRSRRNL